MATEKIRAVVLLSGGLDSSTVAAIAAAEGREVYAMSFDYHQRHRIELDSARSVAKALNVRDHLIVHFDLRAIGGSALTSDMDVPKGTAAGVGGDGSIPVTYVPARNTIFLSFALSWAEVLRAEEIFIGANAVDYSGYPDCRPEYLRSFEEMANLATKISLEGGLLCRISSPLVSMKKSEIVRRGTDLGLDYALTWSCYDPQRTPVAEGSPFPGPGAGLKPCGLCDSCLLRKKGFMEAGLTDPLTELYGMKEK